MDNPNFDRQESDEQIELEVEENTSAHHTSVSRRKFLQIIGVATIGAVASNVMIPKLISTAIASDLQDVQQARALTAASPLYQQTVAELAQQGFLFDLSASLYERCPADPNVIGLSIRSSTVPNIDRQTGADILVTVSLTSGVVECLQSVVGTIVLNVLDIRSVVLSYNGQRDERLRSIILPINGTEPPPPPVGYERCDPNNGIQCRPWYYYGCGRSEWCFCCGSPGSACGNRYLCMRESYYQDCREYYLDARCNTSYGAWYRHFEWNDWTCETGYYNCSSK